MSTAMNSVELTIVIMLIIVGFGVWVYIVVKNWNNPTYKRATQLPGDWMITLSHYKSAPIGTMVELNDLVWVKVNVDVWEHGAWLRRTDLRMSEQVQVGIIVGSMAVIP